MFLFWRRFWVGYPAELRQPKQISQIQFFDELRRLDVLCLKRVKVRELCCERCPEPSLLALLAYTVIKVMRWVQTDWQRLQI